MAAADSQEAGPEFEPEFEFEFDLEFETEAGAKAEAGLACKSVDMTAWLN